MKTKTINLYSFSELSEKAKENAINKLSDINVDFNWWEGMEEDAKIVGIEIREFDCDRNMIKGSFLLSACEVAQNILNNHGETCDTYKTAQSFMEEWQPVFNNYMDESHKDYESRESEDKMVEMEGDFLQSILEDYLIPLRHEFEYLTSEESIIGTIEANEYDFDIDGNMI